MQIEKEECAHIAHVLQEAKKALINNDPIKLKELSNHTIHSSCHYQDVGSITIAVLLYALSKLIERSDYKKIRGWDLFTKKFNSFLDLASKAIEERNQKKYEEYIQKARSTLTSNSVSLKPYIQEIINKSSINKGSKIYEHGISMEQTAKLLGVSLWELSDYIGQKNFYGAKQDRTIDTKKRADMAMEFFE